MGRRVQRTSSQDLKHIILGPTKGKYFRPTEVCDEVYPGIMLGEASTALSTCFLKELKVTHVLNAAHGKNDRYNYGYVNTSFSNYQQAGIKFMGITAQDSPSYYLRSHFNEAADFMDKAVRSGGKVLCHCLAGISRSATLVAAYLMLKKGMNVEEALSTIRKQRSIFPNEGFLSQLCDLDYELRRSGDLPNVQYKVTDKHEMPDDTTMNPAFHPDHRPMFSATNYVPHSCPISRGGYPVTSAYRNSDAHCEDEDFGDKQPIVDIVVPTTVGQESSSEPSKKAPRKAIDIISPPLLSTYDIIPDPRLKMSPYTKSTDTYYYSPRPYTMPYYEPYNYSKYSINDDYPSLIPDFTTYPRPDCYIPPISRIADLQYSPAYYF